MKVRTFLVPGLLIWLMCPACGPSAAERRAQQVAQAKDDALKLRQQLAQAKSGAEAENLRQQIVKVLNDASLPLESIHFTDAELNDYVKAASTVAAPALEAKPAKAARQPKGRQAGKRKRKGS
jgi:hypothetical protein